jgi:c-di-GMP-binding flagellar brake protein YcgR
VHAEQRQSQRKILKTRAMLALEGGAPVLGRTTDISANGVSLTLPQPVGIGQTAQMRFDLLVEGKLVPIHSKARTQYCILSHGEFKVGLQFLNMELNTMTALSRFLR